ncbi:unnamed protein product, partial [Didymodactylos carnosus]
QGKRQLVANLKEKCEQWGLEYARLFVVDQTTPYIHVFTSHLHEFYDQFNNLNTFSFQGVERLNELLTRDYFGGTNIKGEYFQQMIKKRLCQMVLPVTRTQLIHIRQSFESCTKSFGDYESSDNKNSDDDLTDDYYYYESDQEMESVDKNNPLLPSSTNLYPKLDILSFGEPTKLPLTIPSRNVIDPSDFSDDDISDKNIKLPKVILRINTSYIDNVSINWPVWGIENYIFQHRSYNIVNTYNLDTGLFLIYYIYNSSEVVKRYMSNNANIAICERLQRTFNIITEKGWNEARIQWLLEVKLLKPTQQTLDIFDSLDDVVFNSN